MNDPIEMTPLERAWNDLQRFENVERYTRQSAATRDGQRAEPPALPPLSLQDQFATVFGARR